MKNSIEVKGIRIFKNGVHVWNAGTIYDLAGWEAEFTKEEINLIAIEKAKSNYFCNFKWNKSFSWGTICTSKKGNKVFFPNDLIFKIEVKDDNVMLFLQSTSWKADKSKIDDYGFVNNFTEEKHRKGGDFKEVFYLGTKVPNFLK